MRRIALILPLLFVSVPVVHASPTYLWHQRFVGVNDKRIAELVVDPFGSIVAVGTFDDQVTFTSLFVTFGNRDTFIAKFDTNGNPLWSRQIGDVELDEALDVTTDPVGNVIAVGYTGHTVTDTNAFLIKYSPDGTLRFYKRFGAGDDAFEMISCVASDRGKNIIFAGEFDGSMDLGFGTVTAEGRALFLAKMDQTGFPLWARFFPTTTAQNFMLAGMQTGPDGRIVLYGMVDGSVNFGSGPLVSEGAADLFLARFDANGNLVWNQMYGDAADQKPGALALNESAQIVISGYAWGTINLGGNDLTAAVAPDAFLGMFAADGTHVWSKIFPAAGTQEGLDVTWASNQDVLLVCGGFGAPDFGGGPVNIPGEAFQLYLARFFGATGNHRWSTSFSSTLGGFEGYIEEYKGKLILGGGLYGDVDFGGGVDPGSAAGDVYLAGFGDALTGVAAPMVNATLEQNIPNPFNPGTRIGYTLASPARAVIEIYDARGMRVARLDQGMQPAGAHAAIWNGRDRSGQAAASGVYFYRLAGMPASAARKMVLIR